MGEAKADLLDGQAEAGGGEGERLHQPTKQPIYLILPLPTRYVLLESRIMSATISLDSFREDRPLAESIAIATRPIHAKLNKLIIARLPLALPPHATSSLVYASGLMHIAPVYTTFETAWSDIIDRPDPSRVSPRLQETLDSMYLPGLMRRDRLQADIRSMTGWTQDMTTEQLDIISKTGHLAEFLKHIRRAIKSKPHVLLAYSYIMFMSLFAGGRFIRATLESAGDDFWKQVSPSQDSQHPGLPPQVTHGNMPLGFFHFDTPRDGEDLKRNFKERLADAEKSLSYREKHDIVQEAICIFQNTILVVAQLDTVVGGIASHPPSADRRSSADSLATVITNPSSMHRFRDSVAVAKERSARRSSQEMHDKNTPAVTENPHPSQTDNHPMIPPGIGIELCPAASKSIRFEECLPQPSRSHLGVGGPTGNLAESLKMASRRLRREQATNWLLGLAIGLIILCAVLSGRRIVSLE